uniref:Protein kinase domain-containing protein n=1 Tax=Echeneis naucrates TaxID=173247 RepID=A0A665VY40_ECHNA
MHVQNHTNTNKLYHTDSQHLENDNPVVQKSHKKSCRKLTHLPNHLQRLHVKGGVRERQPSAIGLFNHEECLREEEIKSPTLCEKCSAMRTRPQAPERINPLSRRVPLPPVSKKQKGSPHTEQEVRELDVPVSTPPAEPVCRNDKKNISQLQLLKPLCHPRIVRLVAYHHTHTHSYLVMELVSGGDLFEAISERGKFPEADAGLMVSDMSEALNYIHCKSIVHRDLKPENLLVGIRVSEKGVGTKNVTVRLFFTICGTPTYVAPEILCETGYGVAVDVWALGVILYILLCGFPPFLSRDRDQEELFQLIKQGQINFLSPYWDPISEGEKYKIIKYVGPKIYVLTNIHTSMYNPFCMLIYVCVYAEARGLVRALLQPDPTVRLTAEQTLLHPWVKAMASNFITFIALDSTTHFLAAESSDDAQMMYCSKD